MKKVLYGTTALIAAGMFASAAEAAQPIKLSVGGYLNAFIGYTDLEVKDAANAQLNNKFDVATEGQIAFSGETKLDNGVKVGAVAEINLASLDVNQGWLGDVYATVESKYGKAIIGATDNVAVMLHNSAPDAGVFGVDKTKLVNWLGVEGFVDATTNTALDTGVLNIDSTAIDFDGNDQKISYITPKFAGFNVGFSYVPSADITPAFAYGNGALDNSVQRGLSYFRSAYVVAAAYEGKFGGLELGADVAYGNADKRGVNEGHAVEYSAGLNLGYAGFTLGAGYKDQDLNRAGLDNSNAFNVGVGYENGPYALSVSFFQTKNGKVKTALGSLKGPKLDIWQVSGKYKLGAGVDAFATFAYLDSSNFYQVLAGTASASKLFGDDDNTWTIVTGLALKF